MLTGEQLGQAIRAAIKKKGVSQKAVATAFGVKPPSVQDWLNRGVIGKDKLPKLWDYFADVVGPEHWGLREWPAAPLDVREPLEEYVVEPKFFPRVDRRKFSQLSQSQREGIEDWVVEQIERYTEPAHPKSPAGKKKAA